MQTVPDSSAFQKQTRSCSGITWTLAGSALLHMGTDNSAPSRAVPAAGAHIPGALGTAFPGRGRWEPSPRHESVVGPITLFSGLSAPLSPSSAQDSACAQPEIPPPPRDFSTSMLRVQTSPTSRVQVPPPDPLPPLAPTILRPLLRGPGPHITLPPPPPATPLAGSCPCTDSPLWVALCLAPHLLVWGHGALTA